MKRGLKVLEEAGIEGTLTQSLDEKRIESPRGIKDPSRFPLPVSMKRGLKDKCCTRWGSGSTPVSMKRGLKVRGPAGVGKTQLTVSMKRGLKEGSSGISESTSMSVSMKRGLKVFCIWEESTETAVSLDEKRIESGERISYPLRGRGVVSMKRGLKGPTRRSRPLAGGIRLDEKRIERSISAYLGILLANSLDEKRIESHNSTSPTATSSSPSR